MLTEYLKAAMQLAEYEDLGDEGWFRRIPGFDGVWANAVSVEDVRREMRSVLEGWILLGLRLGHHLPEVEDLQLTPALQPASYVGLFRPESRCDLIDPL